MRVVIVFAYSFDNVEGRYLPYARPNFWTVIRNTSRESDEGVARAVFYPCPGSLFHGLVLQLDIYSFPLAFRACI